MKTKKMKCDHQWEFIEKRVDEEGHQLWEFYCKHCTTIKMKWGDGREEIIW